MQEKNINHEENTYFGQKAIQLRISSNTEYVITEKITRITVEKGKKLSFLDKVALANNLPFPTDSRSNHHNGKYPKTHRKRQKRKR